MPHLPALEPGQRFLLLRRAPDLDQRLRGHASAAPRFAPSSARRLHARRLAGLLRIVRRPGRVAEAFRFLPRRQLQQRVERAGTVVDAGVPVADRGEAGRHGAQREVLGRAREELVPASPARRPARRAWGAPSTRRRPCGPWRSGCSRGTRRGAPPSTTCWWRGRARGARPHGRAPGRRAAPG